MTRKETSLADRLSTAAAAKKAQLERARAQAPANDPAFAERQEARRTAGLAREVRQAERKVTKLAEAARAEEERQAQIAARALAAKAEEEARATALAQKKIDDANREVELKAARDARYAARKARRK